MNCQMCGPGVERLQRIAVVGTSGAGKTTLAKALAARLGLSRVELDALHFEAAWREVPDEVFRARVVAAVAGAAWVVDGNYAAARDIVWPRADAVVWLDYARHVVMRRVVWRTLARGITRRELWHGNRERLMPNFFARDGIIEWAWKTWAPLRRRYAALLLPPATPAFAVVHLRTPAETARWLRTIPPRERGASG